MQDLLRLRQLLCSCLSLRPTVKIMISFCIFPWISRNRKAFSVFIPHFVNENESSSSSFFLPPLAQSELLEMSQPIRAYIQREQSHYRLMRRQGIQGFILMTVMCLWKRAVCTCVFISLKHLFIFFVPAVILEEPEREMNL